MYKIENLQFPQFSAKQLQFFGKNNVIRENYERTVKLLCGFVVVENIFNETQFTDCDCGAKKAR